MSRPLRIVTFGVPLSGNKGSASMLLGLIDAFSRSAVEARFGVFSYYPQRDSEVAARVDPERITIHPGHPKHLAFQLLPWLVTGAVLPMAVPARWRQHIDTVRQADLVLLVGGTTFADSMLYKVPWNVLAAMPGYMLGRPSVFVSQTLGPIEHWFNRLCARWTFRRAVDMHGRGRPSAEWAKRAGFPDAHYQPDLSFPMAVPSFDRVCEEAPEAAALRDRIQQSGRPPVGVAPNSIVHHKAGKMGKDYIAFLVGVVREIDAQGKLPVLIPHSYRQDISKLHNNDRALCLAVLDKLGPDASKVHYIDADLSSQQLRSIIGRLHLLVASRFHSMVSALSMGVPPITYGWGHHKYSEVLDEFGVTDTLYHPYQAMDLSAFGPLLREVSEQREELARRISQSLVTVKQQAEQLPVLLRGLVPELSGTPASSGGA